MHSSWKHPYPDERQVLRRKVTAKARRGLHSHEEDLGSGSLLDIADFIISVMIDVEDLSRDVGIALPSRGWGSPYAETSDQRPSGGGWRG
jgi:hypothetical protein